MIMEKSVWYKEDMIFLKDDEYQDRMINQVRKELEEYCESGYFKSYDGSQIYYECYHHPKEKARIVISHGFCEFTKKFEEVIYYFYKAGYSVYIHDHRGHGYSRRVVKDKSKVHVRSYDEYVWDLDQFINQIVLKDSPQAKLVLYAHSMGGAIGALYLEEHPNVFSCAILTSPMMEMDFGKLPVSIARVAVRILRSIKSDEAYAIGQSEFDGVPVFKTSSCLSEERYRYMFDKRLKDENYQTYGASYGWAYASLVAVRKLHKNAGLVKTPTLLFQAGLDTTVKPGGHTRFVRHSNCTKLIVIPNSKHEIYNATSDIIEQYYPKIFAFIEDKLNK